MKRVLLFAMLSGITLLQAQNSDGDKRTIAKGTWNLGGTLSFGVQDTQSDNQESGWESDNFSMSFFPSAGYTIADDWMIGLKTGYSFRRTEQHQPADPLDYNYENKVESISVNPYVRKYFGLTDKLLLHLQGELDYTALWNDISNSNSGRTTSRIDQFGAAIRPGISFFVSQGLALETHIGALQYYSAKTEYDSGATEDNNSFQLNLNTASVLFGLSYYF